MSERTAWTIALLAVWVGRSALEQLASRRDARARLVAAAEDPDGIPVRHDFASPAIRQALDCRHRGWHPLYLCKLGTRPPASSPPAADRDRERDRA